MLTESLGTRNVLSPLDDVCDTVYDKNFAGEKFRQVLDKNFANSPRPRQEVVGGASVPRPLSTSSREKHLAAAPIPFSLEYLLILILVFSSSLI